MPKASNFTSGGVQNRDTKNRRLGTIVTPTQDSKPCEKQISQSFPYCELINLLRNGTIVCCLRENKKTSEKSVFREAWSPELTSQSFPVPCFWSRGFAPHRKWNLMLLVHQNTGKENCYGKNFFATLISTLGRFNQANKKICPIHFKSSVIYSVKRVPNRFGGMRDLAFFRGDIRDLSWIKRWEAGISVASGSGISCFYRVGMRDWQGKQSGIRDFSSGVTSS